MANESRTADTRLSRNDVSVFGVRHLSPMAAFQLRKHLDQVQPTIVLIEGMHDATDLIDDIVRPQTKPPIAILAYSQSVPVRTLVYPVARYSPEYQALAWADEHGVPSRFIDLPSEVFLALQDQMMRRWEEAIAKETSASEEETDPPEELAEPDVAAEPPSAIQVPVRRSVYSRIAEQAGEDDYESFWERYFEHLEIDGGYRSAALELGKQLRQTEQSEQENSADARENNNRDVAENLIRESFMRRCIDAAIAEGHQPQRIVVVVGAFHASALGDELDAMTDSELELLPRLDCKRTLMPYSYFKLSSQSGYGAGNHAPAYFEMLWECLTNADNGIDIGVNQVAPRYLTNVVRQLRASGTHRSTAEVIESVRLARVLTSLKHGHAPVLADLRDAATAVIGQGDRPLLAEPMARVEVGTAIGSLPKGVSQTSIQDDFNEKLGSLKLEKYRATTKSDLTLDLRENRHAKSEQAAFLDLNRSTFLQRLSLLSVPFASPAASHQSSATWAENWQLQWSPEAEIALVEAVLLGETIELASAFRLNQLIEESTNVNDAAKLVAVAVRCELLPGMLAAKSQLQALAAQASSIADAASAAFELMQTIRYGDVRRFDPAPLIPLMGELFVQACLGLVASAQCDQTAAKRIVAAMDQLNQVALQYDDVVDEALWVERLHELSSRDDRNPTLSGYACAILLERSQMDSEELSREVSRRLSPGVAADLGAGWFEGLAGRNRYALLARQSLWKQLDAYIGDLDDEQFTRSVVFLRRAFGAFSVAEKRAISENLGEAWGTGADLASEVLEQPLSETEQSQLDELNEFDFDDF
ncbi:hypothetical protein Pla52n_62180 [Stieleria varia]|uniref:Uncharacterized protein n=2 Tax=Stieleria varia TaxID=2528005 RepID=A0A5C5ZXH8_9BACT|nr:hypothetical protein Pla52n_62180 [Stieleria varia]